MPPVRRLLAAAALAASPALALAQTAPLKPDGSLRYALGGGGSYVSGTTATAASANIGGEGAFATDDSRWRFGGKALWTRVGSQTASDSVTLMLMPGIAASLAARHLVPPEDFAVSGATRRDGVRGVFETGVAIAMSPFCSVNVGLTHRYDGNLGLKASDTLFVTGDRAEAALTTAAASARRSASQPTRTTFSMLVPPG